MLDQVWRRCAPALPREHSEETLRQSYADSVHTYDYAMQSMAPPLHRRTRLVLVGHGRLFRLMLPLVLTNIDQQFVHEHGIGHTTCIIAEAHPEELQCI
jgi:hypothetical protein